MMGMILATVGSGASAKLSEVGMQLAMLGGVALFLGAIRLYLANRTPVRLLLLVGMLLFAVGGIFRTFEVRGVMPGKYYPGWKADMEQQLLIDHADFEYSEDDLETYDPTPAWWEGVLWWSQRLGLVLGAGLAGVGLVLEGRGLSQPAKRTTKRTAKRAKKKAAR